MSSLQSLHTPLISYSSRIVLKPENLQPFGSYKIRGVSAAIECCNTRQLRNGLVAASAGNMAQAVAYEARRRGLPCRIFVPDTAPEVKKDAIRKLEAEVLELPFQKVWEIVRQYDPTTADKNLTGGGLFFHPVFTRGLLEGYGSIVQEILADDSRVDAIVVPFGVGGLTLGLAKALDFFGAQHVQVYACEPETAAPYRASFEAGYAKTVSRTPSFVDAIGTPETLPQVFNQARKYNVQSLVVTLEQTRSAIRELALHHKLICEGAAAAALAGAQQLLLSDCRHRRVAAILTGGNIAPTVFNEIMKD
jgi:threonine dehydratase